MKRFLTLILSIIIVLSLVACGNNKEKKETCLNCGETISANVAFCEYCGTAVSNDNNANEESSLNDSTEYSSEDNKSTDTSKPTDTSNPADTSKPTDTSKPSTPTHTHSYSKKVTAASCKSKGYTTYTCSCGDSYISDYKNTVSHTYSKYVCTMCGTVDKSHSYEYLVEWVKSNGKNDGKNITYIIQKNSSQKFAISYSPEYNNLFVDYYMNPGSSTESYAMLQLDNYFYGFSFYGDSI